MKICKSEIGYRGYIIVYIYNSLGRMIVENHLEDLKILIDKKVVNCSKVILMNGNKTLYKTIKDQKDGDILVMFEECKLHAFLEIEKYYSGGYMNIYVNNVCEILKISLFYYDSEIFKICEKYIRNHINEKMMVEIFNITKLKHFRRSNLYELSKNAIMDNTYKYISEGIIIIIII